MSAQVLLERLDSVRQVTPHKWMAKCPAHADRLPSLSVSEQPDGRALFNCYAGCDGAAVLAAVGLRFHDILPRHLGEYVPLPRHDRPTAPRVPLQEVVSALAHEAHVIVLIVSDLIDGAPLTPETIERLSRAAAAQADFARRAGVAP